MIRNKIDGVFYCYHYNVKFKEHTVKIMSQTGSFYLISKTIEELLEKVKNENIDIHNDLDSKINKKVIMVFS